MGNSNLFSGPIGLSVILLGQTICSGMARDQITETQSPVRNSADGVPYTRRNKENSDGKTTIDPKHLHGMPTLTFSEEFDTYKAWDGHSGLDAAPGWAIAYGGSAYCFNAGDNRTWNILPTVAETQPANPFGLVDGVLTITARPTEPAIARYTSGQPYTSGQVSTYHEFSQTYGYFEMRAQIPAVNGAGSAFWLLSKDNMHPPEIDVAEVLGRDPTALFTTAHSSSDSAGHTSVGSNAHGPIYSTSNWARVTDLSTGYHTYGLNWQPDKITWYLDGEKIFEMKTPSDMNKPMYLLAGVGLGEPPGRSGWVGHPAPDAIAEMKIDYIRAYTHRR
jgi:beta-glucanase (GH16 family)